MTKANPKLSGFTIVELLVVIVVIGILAAITIVSYTGISSRAITSSIQADLANAKKQLALYYVDNGAYPASLDGNKCPVLVGVTDTRYCLKPSGTNTFAYTATPAGSTSPQAYRLTSTNNNTRYAVTNSTQPAIAMTTTAEPTIGQSCPTGFIAVPGGGTYGTNDFCVMKYEAKILGNNNGNQTYSSSFVPDSRAAGTPWVNISQTNAITEAQTYPNCTGCHLITEAEWMTIAQNVLSVNTNWSTNTVGSGYIPRGNSDSSAATDATSDLTGVDKRTLTLTNGEVIWDLAGNVFNWTSGTSTTGQPGITGEGGYAWKEWTAVTAAGSLSPSVSPASTGFTGSSAWDTDRGVGALYSNAGETATRGFLRGGAWYNSSSAGILYLRLNGAPNVADTDVGFRVSR